MTSALAIQCSTWRMRPSTWLCFSLAAWYSAFSERSPCERASAISFTIFGRSTFFRRFSSSLSRSEAALRHRNAVGHLSHLCPKKDGGRPGKPGGRFRHLSVERPAPAVNGTLRRPWYSWIERTLGCHPRAASIAPTAARAPVRVVKYGSPFISVSRRME